MMSWVEEYKIMYMYEDGVTEFYKEDGSAKVRNCSIQSQHVRSTF